MERSLQTVFVSNAALHSKSFRMMSQVRTGSAGYLSAIRRIEKWQVEDITEEVFIPADTIPEEDTLLEEDTHSEEAVTIAAAVITAVAIPAAVIPAAEAMI